MNRGQTPVAVGRWLAFALLGLCVSSPAAFGQKTGPIPQTIPTAVPLINVGGGPMDSQFATLDFAQILLRQQNAGNNKKKEEEHQKKLVESGALSTLDLPASSKAVNEYNQAATLIASQHSQEAIPHLQKAIAAYPSFVSAHIGLGLAYLDIEDTARAQSEFETAVKLDENFAGSFLNLGRLQLSENNFAAAEPNLQRAAVLRPGDAAVLTVLAYAQNGNHEYREAIQTAGRVHGLPHKGMGNAHYVAAVAAANLNEGEIAQREFAFFVQEDPANPLAPTARYNLDILNRNQQAAEQAARASGSKPSVALVSSPQQSLANSDRLKAELAGAGEASGRETSETSGAPESASTATSSIPEFDTGGSAGAQWTIRKAVDEVAVFFGVTSGGRNITDLEVSEIKVRDDNKPPERVLQFTSQSKLPLRLGLLIDTSGSVQPRFSFEKHAAAKFLQQMLNTGTDLGFVAGFSDTPAVTQDFTGDHEKLSGGVDRLTTSGGTALFDAISFGSWKLAAYPERERVAKVLIVVTDGEDNSSHISLRQAIRDLETTGVTVYAISTKEGGGLKTEADKVLQTLAERSGGEALFPGDVGTLGKSFDKLRDQIRSRYLIAYKPADFEPDGKYRTISITAEKGGKQLKVHARKGYHARLEAQNP